MKLGHCQVSHEGPDQHGRFTLTDERRCRSDNGLGTRDTHSPEEEYGEFANEPLENAPVVQELDERDEKDDRRDDTCEEPSELGNAFGCEENDTVVGKAEKKTSKLGDEVENVESNSSAQDKQGNDELEQHADNDCVPVDHAPVARSRPKSEDENAQTEEGHSTIGTCVVLAFLADECTNDDYSNRQSGTSWHAHLLGDEIREANSSVIPDPVHRLSDNGDRDVECDYSDHDGEPEQEGDDPILVLAVYDDTGDPPSGICQTPDNQMRHHSTYPVNNAAMKMWIGSRYFLYKTDGEYHFFLGPSTSASGSEELRVPFSS